MTLPSVPSRTSPSCGVAPLKNGTAVQYSGGVFLRPVPLQIDLKPIEHVRVRNDHELDTILGSDNLVKLSEHSYLVSKLEPKIELE